MTSTVNLKFLFGDDHLRNVWKQKKRRYNLFTNLLFSLYIFPEFLSAFSCSNDMNYLLTKLKFFSFLSNELLHSNFFFLLLFPPIYFLKFHLSLIALSPFFSLFFIAISDHYQTEYLALRAGIGNSAVRALVRV